jgi:phage terminase large subunit
MVFKRWNICGSIPTDARLLARGLDFGFTNDPTAIVDVYQQDGKLWLQEVCYQRGLTNDRIADILRGKEGWTIADSAEQKSITEIRNYGIRTIEPAVKGKDSIRAGIDILQRYEIMITEDSPNVIAEFEQYKWKQDRITGASLNEPEDKNNHAIDAIRYVALRYLAQAPQRTRPRGHTTSF